MSEKRVNIKITASTSDFDKAIKKAQKQIKELTDTIADINKDKFGDELEKQFKNITESAEKAQEQLKDIKDSLDDIDKIKLDKLEKQIKEITDSTEKLNDNLKDTKDAVEDLNKAKTDKLEEGFKDLTDGVKDFNKQLKNIDDSGLRSVENSTKDTSESMNKATDSARKFNNEIDELGGSKLGEVNKTIKDMGENTEKFGNKFSEALDIDSTGINKYKDAMDDIQSANKKLSNGDFSINLGDSKGSLAEVVGTFAIIDHAANKVSNSIEEMGNKFQEATDSAKEMNQLTADEQIKNYDKQIKKLMKIQEQYDKAKNEMDKLQNEKEELENADGGNEFLYEYSKEQLEEAQKYYDAKLKAYEDYEEKRKEILSELNKLEEDRNKYKDDIEKATQALEEQKKVVQDIQKEYFEVANGNVNFLDPKSYLENARRELEAAKDVARELGMYYKQIDRDGNEELDIFNYEDNVRKLDVLQERIDKLAGSLSRNSDLTGWLDKKGIDDEEIRNLANAYKEVWDAVKSGEITTDDLFFGGEAKDLLDRLARIDKETNALGGRASNMKNWMNELANVYDEYDKLTDLIRDQLNAIERCTEAQERYNEALEACETDDLASAILEQEELEKQLEALRKGLETSEAILENFKKNNKTAYDTKYLDEHTEAFEKLEKAKEKAARDEEDYNKSQKQLEENKKRLSEIQSEMKKLNKELKEGDKISRETEKEFNYKLKAYEQLSHKVKEYLENEENGIVLREKVARSFKEVSDAMEKVYAGSSKFNNADLIKQTLDDAKKYIEELDVVSTKNIQADLERLGEIIEDKTEKIKRFKEVNKDFGTESSKNAYGLEKQAESLKEYADSMKVAIEATDTLKDAWGDLKIGDEDHLKIRARKELLSDYAKTLNRDIKKIKEAYQDLESLEDMLNSDKVSDKDKQKIRDYQDWEKNRDALVKYNKAIEEYITTLLDANGKIDDKFLTDGKFDVDKFIKDFEKMGTSTMVLSKQINAVRTELLENIKAQKEAAQHAVENAKAAKEEAEAAVKNAKTAEEEAEATERLKKAKQELNEAKEKSKKIDKDRIEEAQKLIKAYNEQAEALRKLGIQVKDISKADISGFDKSLGSILDGMDTFSDGNKIKSFGDFFEDIKGVFANFNSFDLGDLAGGFGDIFGNVLDLIPGKAKLAAAAIMAVVTAINKLYEAGKQQFFEGLEKGWSFITKIGDIARDVGQEVKDAFEDITGTQLDWSSLMALGPEFEYQMEKVGAIAGSNEKQLEDLIKKAKELGGTTQFKASEVGEAFEYMAMAGFDTQEMLDSINGTLALSIGSGTDLAKTTDIVTDYMTALGLEANSTNDFVDKLAATITSSNTTVEKWGQSMKNVAAQAHDLGIGMTELSTAIGLMANAGVKGSKAGTALKNVLANMNSPTKKQAAALKQLGFVADPETGSYLIDEDKDGNVDLGATLKKFIEAKNNPNIPNADALIAAVAGKEALPGLMALLSQGAEGWDELSDTIENSTGKVQYWNECMSLAGKSGEDAVKAIDNMKEVFAELEDEGLNAGLSSEELSHAIAILGDNGKVTADDVRSLINVIDSMNTATGEAEEKWRALDKAGDDAINTGYDYNATIAKITADTSGLSQEKKELIKKQLDENMSYEEANKILKEYGLTAERTSFANMSYADKLIYLRNNLEGLSDEQIKTELTNLGLADSFDEILEVLKMTGPEFEQYAENLKSVKGMAESLKDAMGETTKAGLLELASAIENVAIAAFDRFEPAINEAVDALNEFFEIWHNRGDNKFTFDGFETALAGIADKIVASQPQIQAAVESVFDTIHRLVHGDETSLDSLLDIGTSVITGICDGILNSEEELAESIDSFIKKICAWIQENGPRIEEAGKMLLDAITEGIENNEGIISDAMNTICDIITTWTNSSGELKAAAGLFAEQFVALALESMWIGAKNWFKEKATAFAELFTGPFDLFGAGGAMGLGLNLWANILEGLFGSDIVGDTMTWLTDKLGSFNLLEFIFDLICKPFSGVFKAADMFGDWNPIEDIKGWFNDKVGDWSFVQWAKDKLTGKDDSKDSKKSNKKSTKKLEQVDVETLVNIDEKELSEVEDALVKLQTAAQKAAGVIRTEFVNMTNIARNQMLNISNIIRNQAINWANIIRNQAKNARDGFTQQMISMASVARTQLVNVSNIIRNQSLSWYNVINNQTKNARDAFTRQMMSMVKVARNQMYNVLSTVRSYMSQITGATNKSISLNVGQSGGSATLPTTPALAMADALYAANAASTYSLDASGISSRASSASSNNSSASYGPSEANIIHTHVYLEGREIAKASAKYMNHEIQAINKRENRKRGVK